MSGCGGAIETAAVVVEVIRVSARIRSAPFSLRPIRLALSPAEYRYRHAPAFDARSVS